MANNVTYKLPSGGLNTPPTAAVAKKHSLVTGTVATDGATASIVITHNMGLSAADLAGNLPIVQWEALSALLTAENLFVASKDANTVTLTCSHAAAVTFNFAIWRPNTATR